MPESISPGSDQEHSISGLVSRIMAEQGQRKEPLEKSIGSSSAWDILSSPGISEISSRWASPSNSVLGAAAAAAATGMAGWLGESPLLDGTSTFPKRPRRKSAQFKPSSDSRFLIAAGQEPGESVLLILDPQVGYSSSRRVTHELRPDIDEMMEVMDSLGAAARESSASERNESADILAALPAYEAAVLANTIAPEVIVTSMPRMTPLGVPTPHIVIKLGEEESTAGMFCRDAEGRFGITACFHGTGPIGTEVEVGLRTFRVELANPVQDVVFIPLGEDYNVRELCATGGTVSDRAPGQQERATFEGSTSGAAETVISSHDAGLLRRRATVQLKLQTRPDAQRGDSGSALVDQNGKVMAFAFERTAFGEYPEFTDWIWADNALASLGLVPLTNE